MGSSIIRPLVLCALVQAAAVVATAQEAPPDLSRRIDSLFNGLGSETPGAAVAVVRNGEVLYRQSYGMANLEQHTAVTTSTVFDIASFSKQFTGMATAMLLEQGRISLADDIRSYIPEVPDFGTPITVRHLIHHISGIRDWPATLGIAGWQMDDVISFDQIMTMVRYQQDLNFEPGAEYSYSNTGYNLLAELVARVTGQTFREWTDANIFQPLGMERTHFQDDHREIVEHRANGYAQVDGAYVVTHNGLTAMGSSSLFTTIDDLVKWAANFDMQAVGGPAVIARMHERGVLNDGERIAYAYGLNIGEYRGLTTASHGGSWASFRTHFLRFPEQRFTVMVLSNLGSFNPSSRCYNIAELYLGDLMEPEETVASAAERPAVAVDGAVLDEYVGTYRLGPGWLVTITREGDSLMTQATAEPRFSMKAVSQTEFWVDDYGAGIDFQRDSTGAVASFAYRGMEAPRVELFQPTVAQLSAFVGDYYSEELDTTYRLTLKSDSLIALHRRHGEIGLIPTVQDEFRGDSWLLSPVSFVRDARGNVSAMLVGAGRARNLRFVRR